MTHNASTCRWAQPTLLLPDQTWLFAADCPWSCQHDAKTRVLQTTAVCEYCPRWEPRPATAATTRATD